MCILSLFHILAGSIAKGMLKALARPTSRTSLGAPTLLSTGPRIHQKASGELHTVSSQQCLREDRLEPVAEGGGFLFGLLQAGQQLFGVAVVVGDGVRVLEVQVVPARFYLFGGDAPGDFAFDAAFAFRAAPPVDAGLEALDARLARMPSNRRQKCSNI